MGEGPIFPCRNVVSDPGSEVSAGSGCDALHTPEVGSFRFSDTDAPEARWSEGVELIAANDAPEVLEELRGLVLGLNYESAVSLAEELDLTEADDEVRALLDLCSLRLS